MIVGRVGFEWGNKLFPENRFFVEESRPDCEVVDNTGEVLWLKYNKERETSKYPDEECEDIKLLTDEQAIEKLKDYLITRREQKIEELHTEIKLIEKAFYQWKQENN